MSPLHWSDYFLGRNLKKKKKKTHSTANTIQADGCKYSNFVISEVVICSLICPVAMLWVGL